MDTAPAYGHDLRHDRALLRTALAGAARRSFWLDDPSRPDPHDPLASDISTDLLVVGGGYCGLWTALIAKERDPERTVVLVEGRRVGWAASGRNGGFVEASLTHGADNGELHFPTELATLDRLAEQNFEGLVATIDRYGIDAQLEREPTLTVATEEYQARAMAATGGEVLVGAELAAYAASPLFRAGRLDHHGNAFVHPAKLAWGLARAARDLGVTIYENTPATSLRSASSGGHVVTTPGGSIRASKVALATNGFPSLLKRIRPFTVPIYDYVLMTEPLTTEQLQGIGWTGRHGITDSGREFHYYRKTADDRILFGGYDAIYHRGGRIRSAHDQRDESFERLADHFYSTFPSLRGHPFSHRWGGMIDMSTQLVAFHGAAKKRTVAYSAGYTGLGVAATRFGAETMLDFLDSVDRGETERTRLRMSRRLPVPIPPEPLAYPLIQTMRRAVAKSDANGGTDGPLLRLAALFGVGFDS